MDIVGFAAVAGLVAAGFLLRIVPEGSRYAVFELGKFKALKGAGVVFRAPFGMSEWVLLELGTKGDLVEPGLIKVGGRLVPVEHDDSALIGSVMRIARFGDKTVVVTPVSLAWVTCPRCGLVFDHSKGKNTEGGKIGDVWDPAGESS